MVIDSATASGPGGRPAAVTASSRTVGEDEDAGTGLSLVIDGVRHLQITTRPVPALKRAAQTLASRLCSDPGPHPRKTSSLTTSCQLSWRCPHGGGESGISFLFGALVAQRRGGRRVPEPVHQ